MGTVRATVVIGMVWAAGAAVGAEAKFGGTWDTSFGSMTLVQNDDEVRGTYLMGGLTGEIEGRVRDGKLVFRYREPDAAGEGEFDLAEDGRSFAGRWREKGSAEWSQWMGKRVAEAADPFDGVWDSPFGRMRLVQDGNKVRGCYGFDAGEIEGTVSGRRLNFKYSERAEAGAGRFDLSEDGATITGKWKREGAAEWSDWPATRVEPEAGVSWLVVIETQWEEGDLRRSEYAFGDMLRAFFAGNPQVRVRHRIFDEANDLTRWCRETSYLPEPAVLLIASHGTPEGVVAEGGTIVAAEAIGEALRHADNVRLLHFSSCLVMKGPAAEQVRGKLDAGVRFPVSGYATAVDWAGSAVSEFMYLNLVLGRNLAPKAAFEELGRLIPFSGETEVPGASMPPLGMRMVGE